MFAIIVDEKAELDQCVQQALAPVGHVVDVQDETWPGREADNVDPFPTRDEGAIRDRFAVSEGTLPRFAFTVFSPVAAASIQAPNAPRQRHHNSTVQNMNLTDALGDVAGTALTFSFQSFDGLHIAHAVCERLYSGNPA